MKWRPCHLFPLFRALGGETTPSARCSPCLLVRLSHGILKLSVIPAFVRGFWSLALRVLLMGKLAPPSAGADRSQQVVHA